MEQLLLDLVNGLDLVHISHKDGLHGMEALKQLDMNHMTISFH